MIEAVTSFSPAGFAEYGERFMATFLYYWPREVRLCVYYEQMEPSGFRDERVAYTDIMALSNATVDFVARYGSIVERKKAEARKPFRYDATKFCRKVFAVEHAALRTRADKLYWLDADMVTFAPPTVGFLESLLPEGCYLSSLQREGYHDEVGFMGFNTSHPAHAEWMARYAGMYRDGKFLEEREWHDGFLFSVLRRRMEAEGKFKSFNLSPGAPRGGHPWLVSPLATCFDHKKGARKLSGKSWQEDLEKMGARRREDYWKEMPSRYGRK